MARAVALKISTAISTSSDIALVSILKKHVCISRKMMHINTRVREIINSLSRYKKSIELCELKLEDCNACLSEALKDPSEVSRAVRRCQGIVEEYLTECRKLSNKIGCYIDSPKFVDESSYENLISILKEDIERNWSINNFEDNNFVSDIQELLRPGTERSVGLIGDSYDARFWRKLPRLDSSEYRPIKTHPRIDSMKLAKKIMIKAEYEVLDVIVQNGVYQIRLIQEKLSILIQEETMLSLTSSPEETSSLNERIRNVWDTSMNALDMGRSFLDSLGYTANSMRIPEEKIQLIGNIIKKASRSLANRASSAIAREVAKRKASERIKRRAEQWVIEMDPKVTDLSEKVSKIGNKVSSIESEVERLFPKSYRKVVY